jgi:HK97 gp10 family phage protein
VAVNVRIEIHGSVLNRLLRSPTGPVARDMLKRGRKVQAAARRRINSRTGNLSRSIDVHIVIAGGAAGVKIGTDLFYAKFVHDGTGIHGPSNQPIKPRRRGGALSFQGRGGAVVVASSSGQRGTHFLRNALRAAR